MDLITLSVAVMEQVEVGQVFFTQHYFMMERQLLEMYLREMVHLKLKYLIMLVALLIENLIAQVKRRISMMVMRLIRDGQDYGVTAPMVLVVVLL